MNLKKQMLHFSGDTSREDFIKEEALEEGLENLVPIMTKALKKALFQLGDDAKDSEILKIAREIVSHKIPLVNGSHIVKMRTLLNGLR